MAYILLLLIVIPPLIWVLVLRPRRRAKQAAPYIIKFFRDQNAVGKKNAKTVHQLGFKFVIPKSTIGRILRAHDYRVVALHSLMKANIVQRTEKGKLYLSEENLAVPKRKRKPKREGENNEREISTTIS